MAKEKESRTNAGMGGSKSEKKSKKSSSKKPHSIYIRRGASGGYIVTHHHKPKENEMAQEAEDHVVPDLDQLQQHVSDSMGDQPEQEMQPSPQAEPAQAAPPQGM